MVAVNERQRLLLEKIAAEGKATKIAHDDLRTAKVLEGDGLLFLVNNESAIITPKGRRLLAKEATKPKRDTPPFRFT